MNLTIIGNPQTFLKEFKTPEEFELYYSKNKDELDKWTTQKLNKCFHIPNLRITKVKGQLCLKVPYVKKNKEGEENYNGESCTALNNYGEMLEDMMERIANLEKFCSELKGQRNSYGFP